MRRIALATLFCWFLIAFFLPAEASPLFPCPKAVSSTNGRFLVIVDVVTKPGASRIATVKSVSFQIFPKEDFINAKDRVLTANPYWTDWARWKLVLGEKEIRSETTCPAPLISDDGEFLVLLRTGPVFADDAAIRVYRWNHQVHEGISSTNKAAFVAGIPLRQLWPPDRLSSTEMVWTDATPQWFAGGKLVFSDDNQQLVYSTQWGTSVRIQLTNGSVAKAPPQEYGR
jgi:hypothetical protein